MQEIEVKARVKNQNQLMSKLGDLGIKLSEPIFQHDTIFAEQDWEFTQFVTERNILRIRRENNRTVLTLKRPGKNELDAEEHETEISNPDSMSDMLKLMEYLPVVEVKKERQKAKYNQNHPSPLLRKGGEIEICLDEVEELGTYIEVEKLVKEADTEKVQEELFQFLESLGIARSDRETHGYDTLMRLKQIGQ